MKLQKKKVENDGSKKYNFRQFCGDDRRIADWRPRSAFEHSDFCCRIMNATEDVDGSPYP